jgi:RNA polymerase sigma factor (sigma-70 family)
MDAPDAELIHRTRRGDAEAFGALFARHRALVLAYLVRRCRREDAADLLAETFAAALVAVHDGRAPEGATAAPWLLTIARNKLLDARRRGRVRTATVERLALERPPATEAVLDELEAIGKDMDRALARLPEDQRAALKARILEEREYEEIAREQESTETAVRQRVSRALRKLRAELGEPNR